MIQPWPKLRSKQVGDYRIFTIREDLKRSPRTGREHDFFIIESVNWVNVIAVTPQRELVMIEQYRHGSNTVELEVPGGMMDPHESSPVAAAERELREETGYAGGHARVIGSIFPNPAIMSNTCYTVLVENCRCDHPVDWDHGEDIVTRLVPISDLPGLIASGRIGHSLVVVALYHFDLLQRGVTPQ
jgi:8-oxo-dGTP pyrophosphatase MutT (NUDIX family)